MLRQSLLRRTATVLSPILLLCGALVPIGMGSAQSPPPKGVQSSCPTATEAEAAATDAEIVAAIQAKIKTDSRFNDQWKHIHASSKNRVVILSGWARGPRQVRDLFKFASSTKCVRKVVNRLWDHLKIGCTGTQKQCGETCIDRNEQCNLIQEGGPPQ